VLAERTAAILHLVETYPPDVMLVDHAPAGLGGELLPVLSRLRAQRPGVRFVLGLRDIVGGAASTRRAWTRYEIPDLFETLYDAIVVFGQQEYFDPIAEYGLSSVVAEKTRFVGYLGEAIDSRRAQTLRRCLVSGDRPLVIGAVGGGEDGYPVLAALLEAHRRWPARARFDSVLIGGPLMPMSDRRQLAEASARAPGTRFIDEVANLPEYLAASDAVVAMAGFNTTCELFAAARPVVLVPRSARESDQAYRGTILARHRHALTIPLDELEPDALLQTLDQLLDGTVRLAAPPPLRGREGFVAVVDALLADARQDLRCEKP
jgi:predicted glycosyltransferase